MPMSDKSQDYWEGFADGQRDIESQMEIEESHIEPNEFIHKLDLYAGWLRGLIQNNGSDEIDDEGAPIYADYSDATVAGIAAAFTYARLLRVVSACIFRLNQKDFTEEHFHHELNHALNMMEQGLNIDED
jgi:uncharacterized protein (UPF0261 family)